MIIVEAIDERLMRTYSDDEKKVIKKVGTNEIYGSAVDVIEGENNGVPYGRFQYEEIDMEENRYAIQHGKEED